MTAILKVDEAFGGYGAADEILKGISVEVSAGQIVTIIGPNGAGKSTFLKAVAGLLPLRQGRIVFEGADITGSTPLDSRRRAIGFVPQERNIFGTLTVRENLEISAYAEPASIRPRTATMFERYPMLAQSAGKLARNLSGGQKQILAMAMALMLEPRLLLLDEPTAGLSPKAAGELFATIREINAGGTTVLMVEQNALDALGISHLGYVLVSGRNSRRGQGMELANDPEIKRLFLGAIET